MLSKKTVANAHPVSYVGCSLPLGKFSSPATLLKFLITCHMQVKAIGRTDGILIYKHNNATEIFIKSDLIHNNIYVLKKKSEPLWHATSSLYFGVWVAGTGRFYCVRYSGEHNRAANSLTRINPDKFVYEVVAKVDYEPWLELTKAIKPIMKKHCRFNQSMLRG